MFYNTKLFKVKPFVEIFTITPTFTYIYYNTRAKISVGVSEFVNYVNTFVCVCVCLSTITYTTSLDK